MIVGRDTGRTSTRPEIDRACVETVGENANDAVVAPLFWLAVGGPGGALGLQGDQHPRQHGRLRNARYRHLGRASARLDDLANLVPARLTWLLIAPGRRLRRRGRGLRPSGSAGATAGSTPAPTPPGARPPWPAPSGSGSAGRSTYGGVPSRKPYLGDPPGPDRPGDRPAGRPDHDGREPPRGGSGLGLPGAGCAMIGRPDQPFRSLASSPDAGRKFQVLRDLCPSKSPRSARSIRSLRAVS